MRPIGATDCRFHYTRRASGIGGELRLCYPHEFEVAAEMAPTSANTAALAASSPSGLASSGCLSSGKKSKYLSKHCFLVAVALLLFAGVVSLSVLAKDGQYYPQSSAAHRISKASKMSQQQLPELANERQDLVPAFPSTSHDANEGLQLNDLQEILLPRDAAVLASLSLRSPPQR